MIASPSEGARTLLAVDGTALGFRAFFAIRGLTDPRGRPIGALHGFGMALAHAMEQLPAEAIAVAWDTEEKTFREEMEVEYKANREELDEGLVLQFPWMMELVELMGIPSLTEPGWEADDLIASLAVRAEREGWQVRIYSNDKDMAQLVDEQVLWCIPGKAGEPIRCLGPHEVEEKFGVPPRLMRAFQALVGDASDNVQGVPGVGPKTAARLLQRYGSLEAVLERGPVEEKGKLAERLAEHADDARRALELVTLATDREVPPPEELRPGEPDLEGLREFFAEHGMQTLEKRILAVLGASPSSANTVAAGESSGEARAAADDVARDYRAVTSTEELVALRDALAASEGFALDTETTGTRPLQCDLVGLSVALAPGRAHWVATTGPEAPRGPDGEEPLAFLAPVLGDAGIAKYGQNLKFDDHVLRRHGAEVCGWSFDTMIAHFLVDPSSSHGLDALAQRYLGLEKIPTKELLGTGRSAITMAEVDAEKICEYACEDADVVLRLAPILERELEAAGETRLFRDVEMPLVFVLREMEANGVRLASERLHDLEVRLRDRIEDLERQAYALVGHEVNLNSPKQLGTVLFEELKVQDGSRKKPSRTKTGWRTDAQTLEHYAEHPFVRILLEYRRLTKLVGTYVEKLPQWVNPETGLVHTSFHQAVASTGRLSSSDPNLQNIPIRGEEGQEIRRAFVPLHDDWKMLSADYSQLDLRVLAHLSEDEALLRAFHEGVDIHRRTAALLFGVPEGEVTRELRNRAKTINYGIIYGMGPARLARETGISFGEARKFIARYMEALPGVHAWIERTLAEAEESGEVRTVLGRRRPLPDLQSADGRVRAAARNAAINTPVQGSSADVVKVAMLKVWKRLHDGEAPGARMLLQVHDELVFDCPPDQVEALSALVHHEMEHALELRVPLVADVGVGSDWASAH